MIKLSRRKFLCGVAAIAVVAPATEFAIPDMRYKPQGGIGDRTALVIGYADRGAIIVTDLLTYGQSFERFNADGTRTRIDPRDVYLT